MGATSEVFSRLESIQRSESVSALDDAVELAVADYGGVAFSIGTLGAVFRERGQMPWIRFYHESGLHRTCAFARRTQTSLSPFTWDEEIVAEEEETRAVASAAASFGLRHGLHVPVVTRAGLRGAVFVQTEKDVLDIEARQSLTLYALAALSRLEQMDTPLPAQEDKLSGREREVLSWFAEGKTAEDVGSILDLSPATVMYHYRAVADRYGTLNRTHTVVEAIRRGDLQVG